MPGIYIHFPFCKQACHYCDFHFSVSMQKKTAFLEALDKEIKLQKNYFLNSRGAQDSVKEKPEMVTTIYFGGGTPSLFSSDEITAILDALIKNYAISEDAEVTMEANPDDMTYASLKSWLAAGINRLSVGIQSFADEDLKFMNRAHDAGMAVASLKTAQDAGFKNISLDLIYGTPTLSNNQWIQNLQMAFTSGVPHLSCYSLTVEAKTALAQFIKAGKILPLDEIKSAEQFELLMTLATENGYEQYEISNFAKNKLYSIHNSNYWKNDKYLGLGPSAHSYNGISRQWNAANNSNYIESIKANRIPCEMEMLTDTQRYNEYILTSLRTIWGCDSEIITTRFGEDFTAHFNQSIMDYISKGWIEKNNAIYVLTGEGKYFADKIAAGLFR